MPFRVDFTSERLGHRVDSGKVGVQDELLGSEDKGTCHNQAYSLASGLQPGCFEFGAPQYVAPKAKHLLVRTHQRAANQLRTTLMLVRRRLPSVLPES